MAISPVTLDKISSVTPTPGVSQANSSSKSIQTEIASKQQHLKRISSDTTITASEREQKRRELQKEIDELNRKLQQQKLEQKEEAAEAAKKQEAEIARKAEVLEKESSSEKATEDKQDHRDMPVEDIQQMLSADYLIQKERVQEQVNLKKESTIHILEAEIEQDKLHGANTSRKEAELEALQQKENFWSDAQKQTEPHVQAQTMNTKAHVVIDQI